MPKLTTTQAAVLAARTPPGLWIWKISSFGSDLTTLIGWLNHCKCQRVYLKVFDDLGGPHLLAQASAANIKTFRDAGISVVGWGYHFDQTKQADAAAHAALIADVVQRGLDGYIVDVEVEVEDPATHADVRSLMIALRGAVGSGFLGYTSFGHPGFHPKVPWRILDELADIAFPQIYFEKWRGAAWGLDDNDRVGKALEAHAKLGLTCQLLPIWGSEPDTKKPATPLELQSFINRRPGSSIFMAYFKDGKPGPGFEVDYTPIQMLPQQPDPAPDADPTDPTDDADPAPLPDTDPARTTLTFERMAEIAMKISGGFEGGDPWANITGDFDGEGLTCGMLGKTIKSGGEQRVVKAYIQRYGVAELHQLMPIKGGEYLDLVRLPEAIATAVASRWSDPNRKSRVREPYRSELAAFWKSPRMVATQIADALAREGKFARENASLFGFGDSLQAFVFFFDIATQSGSMKTVRPLDLNNAIGTDSLDAVRRVCTWCENADSRPSSEDCIKNGRLWRSLAPTLDEISRRLLVLGWLRARLSVEKWQLDAMCRRGTLAVGEGWVHGSKKQFREDLFREIGSGGGGGGGGGDFDDDQKTKLKLYRVNTTSSTLNLRSTPDKTTSNNILAKLPRGSIVRVAEVKPGAEWWQVQADFSGGTAEGWVWAAHLTPAESERNPTVAGIQAVHLKPSARLANRAGATPLAEPGAPMRDGTTPEEKTAELASIIAFLNVKNSRRYQPIGATTFCNIYSHDYCYLAGVYLPRVWWKPKAIEKLARGQEVEVNLGTTVDEMRANDLCRWFIDYGPTFGWRRTTDLTELQTAANKGEICIIVARRIVEARSGHIVAVVPETATAKASRDSQGNVLLPLQSQAGVNNFSYSTGTKKWWLDDSKFQDHGLWIHA